MALYFASQGAGALHWPLFAGFARMVIAVGGGWLLLRWTGNLTHGVCGAGRGPRRVRPDDRGLRSGAAHGFAGEMTSAAKPG